MFWERNIQALLEHMGGHLTQTWDKASWFIFQVYKSDLRFGVEVKKEVVAVGGEIQEGFPEEVYSLLEL